MYKKIKRLSLLLPFLLVLGCDAGSEPASKNASARAGSEASVEAAKAAPLTGDALYNSDKAPDTLLYDKPQKVVDGVWSAIGATAPMTYANGGHNNNLSFVITDEGVLIMNAGANYLLAKALHAEIKKITDKPVKYVVLENGQAHAMLGTSYWQEQGAIVIAHEDAAKEIEEHGEGILENMKGRLKEEGEGTTFAMPDKTFKDEMHLELGGVKIDVLRLGPAHSPGDILVWLPQKSVVISGDMAFHQRMLPLFDHTDTAGWIETWDKFEGLQAKYVIPGHGDPTDMTEVTRYTKDYLVYLRGKISVLLDEGGSLQDAYKIDQSAYAHLPTSEFLSRSNAGQIFRSMEFE